MGSYRTSRIYSGVEITNPIEYIEMIIIIISHIRNTKFILIINDDDWQDRNSGYDLIDILDGYGNDNTDSNNNSLREILESVETIVLCKEVSVCDLKGWGINLEYHANTNIRDISKLLTFQEECEEFLESYNIPTKRIITNTLVHI